MEKKLTEREHLNKAHNLLRMTLGLYRKSLDAISNLPDPGHRYGIGFHLKNIEWRLKHSRDLAAETARETTDET